MHREISKRSVKVWRGESFSDFEKKIILVVAHLDLIQFVSVVVSSDSQSLLLAQELNLGLY